MGYYLRKIRESFLKGDLVLLLICVVMNVFGLLMIASTTNHMGNTRYLVVQGIASLLGILMFVLISSIDADVFSEHRYWLVVFNVFLLLLLIPFGTDNETGNKSWLNFPFLPFDIQPAEICKITYVLIMASVMASYQNRISSVRSVITMAVHLGLLAGLNMVLSRDLGVTLIFVFIFIGMAFTGGVSSIWFWLLAAASWHCSRCCGVFWIIISDCVSKFCSTRIWTPWAPVPVITPCVRCAPLPAAA